MKKTLTLRRILELRLAAQSLASPHLLSMDEVVRRLVCSQAQDAPLARWSLGVRLPAATDESIRSAIDAGSVVRTHILRPTWHYVCAEDLVWLQALTARKVANSMATRGRGLGLTPGVTNKLHDRLAALLDGGRFFTRKQIVDELAISHWDGEKVGHVLALAELRALICSGPLDGAHHTYALVSSRVPVTPARERPDAVRELARRFFTGHGPASISDFTRFSWLTKAEAAKAVEALSGELEVADFDGHPLWYGRSDEHATPPAKHAYLLPVYDESILTYPHDGFPRIASHPMDVRRHVFAGTGAGVVICDFEDVGVWKRSVSGRTMHITLTLAADLTRERVKRIHAAAESLGTFAGFNPVISGGSQRR